MVPATARGTRKNSVFPYGILIYVDFDECLLYKVSERVLYQFSLTRQIYSWLFVVALMTITDIITYQFLQVKYGLSFTKTWLTFNQELKGFIPSDLVTWTRIKELGVTLPK